MRQKNWLRENWLRVITHIGAWLPLMWLSGRALDNALGVDPVTTINNVTGRTAMLLLLLCLSATPLYIVLGLRAGLTVRRALGLYAFVYAALHFLNFIALDYAFDWRFILADGIQTKPYIVVGFVALWILSALALTSTRGWMRRLKRNWTRLHWLIYPAGLLVMLHFFWQAKAAEKWEPLIYAAALAALFGVRAPPLRGAFVHWRQRHRRAKASHATETPKSHAPAAAPQTIE